MSSELLKALGLDATNAGTYLGNGEWSTATSAGVITPINPTTGEAIATVHATTDADYETIIARAQEAFKVWRTTPAPRRGEAVRLCGEALRANKDALGSLVALEMGKSKPEGDGEVQEMIDIADFAVGQSRMLSARATACTSSTSRWAWSASSVRSTSRWRCGRGIRSWPRSAAISACGSRPTRPR